MAYFWTRDLRFYWGGYDPGSHTTRLVLGLEAEPLDRTSFGDGAERTQSGLRRDTVTWAGLFDDGADAMDVAAATLVGTSTNNVMSFLIGTATGDVAYSGTVVQLDVKTPSDIRDLVRQEASFKPDQAWDRGKHFGPVSTLLGTGGPNVTGSIDNSALSTGSATWYIHFISVAGGTSTIFLQDSADGTSFAALGTLVGTGKIARKITVGSGADGTVRRYTRVSENNATGTDTQIVSVIVRLS